MHSAISIRGVHIEIATYQSIMAIFGMRPAHAVTVRCRLRSYSVVRVAEIAAWLVSFGIGSPAAVEADHAQERQFVPDRGVEFHRVLPEGAVAVQADDLGAGLGGLGADRKRQPHPPWCRTARN